MEQTKSKYQKIVDIIALVIASGLCIFQLYSASFGTWSSFVLSAVHWGVIGSYIILRNPTKLKGAGPVDDLAITVRVTNARTFTMPDTGARTGPFLRVLRMLSAIGCLGLLIIHKKKE